MYLNVCSQFLMGLNLNRMSPAPNLSSVKIPPLLKKLGCYFINPNSLLFSGFQLTGQEIPEDEMEI